MLGKLLYLIFLSANLHLTESQVQSRTNFNWPSVVPIQPAPAIVGATTISTLPAAPAMPATSALVQAATPRAELSLLPAAAPVAQRAPVVINQVQRIPTLEEARATLWGVQVRSFSLFSSAQAQAFKVVLRNYAPGMLGGHTVWHGANGLGGELENGGVPFQDYHDALLRDLEAYIGGGFITPPLLPLENIPEELSVDDAYLPQYGARSLVTLDELPGYLTERGGFLPSTGEFIRLSDIRTKEQWGRLMGPVHRRIHRRFGGVMLWPNVAPVDPVFWGVHAMVRQTYRQWLATSNGQIWNRANPDNLDLPASFYTIANMGIQDDGCSSWQFQQDAICRELRATAQSSTTTTNNLAQPGTFRQNFGFASPFIPQRFFSRGRNRG